MVRRIRLADACAEMFIDSRQPVQTSYDIQCAIAEIFFAGNFRGRNIYASEDYPSDRDYRRVVSQLKSEHRLSPDPDFSRSVFRVNELPDGDAQAICCLVDPYCCLSHLSAMEAYGLTDRISGFLILTTAEPRTWRRMAGETAQADLARLGYFLRSLGRPAPRHLSFPARVRGRGVHVVTRKRPETGVDRRDGWDRTSSIGQTFLQMLESPRLCGGIDHVLEVWGGFAGTYLEQIVQAYDQSESKILKVRAGYVLEERMGIRHPIVDGWTKFAQRGSSRVLNPGNPYAPRFSEKWMISINP